MAGQEQKIERDPKQQDAITLGFSMLAGLGLTIMIAGAAVGVMGGTSADSNNFGVLIAAGVLMFIIGGGVWMSYVRPWENFDDINEPHYHGHHHHEEEHAIVPAEDEHAS